MLEQLNQFKQRAQDTRVLFLQSDSPIGDSFGIFLKAIFPFLHSAKDTDEALHQIKKYKYDLVITDYMPPRESLIRLLRADYPETKIVLTANCSNDGCTNITNVHQVEACFPKPVKVEMFLEKIDDLI